VEIIVTGDSTSYVFDRYHGGIGVNSIIKGKYACDASVSSCLINSMFLKMRFASAVFAIRRAIVRVKVYFFALLFVYVKLTLCCV
jgi:hypothetical protein